MESFTTGTPAVRPLVCFLVVDVLVVVLILVVVFSLALLALIFVTSVSVVNLVKLLFRRSQLHTL